MEKTISNKTLWVLKRAELMNNPQKRKSIIETSSNRSSVAGRDEKKLNSIQNTPKPKKKNVLKTKSISDLPDLTEKICFPPTNQEKKKTFLKNSPHSMVLDEKYNSILPTIQQLSANMLIPKRDLRNDDDLLSPSDLFESPLIKKRLVHSKKLDSNGATVLSIRYNQSEEFIAMGCDDGITRITDVLTSKVTKFKSPVLVPVTSVRWSPSNENQMYQTKANGTVEIWDLYKNSIIHTFIEEGNFIFSSDHNFDGSYFCTAGQDARIRVYDGANPGKLLHIFSRLANPTHSNRIYSLKFCEENKNLVLSGGWDETLILWDIRTPNSANFIYGPLICGDSLDNMDQRILTGSWREARQLQLWDMRNLKEISHFEWNNDPLKEKPFIYSCCFEKKSGKYIVAGSSGVNEIRLYDNGKKYECLDIEFGFAKGIYSLDCSRYKNQFCYGSEKTGIYSIY